MRPQPTACRTRVAAFRSQPRRTVSRRRSDARAPTTGRQVYAAPHVRRPARGGRRERSGGADHGTAAGPVGDPDRGPRRPRASRGGRVALDLPAARDPGHLGHRRGGQGDRGRGRDLAGGADVLPRGRVFHVAFADSGDSPFPPWVNIGQARVEQVLDERIADAPLVDVRWGTTVTGISQDDRAVRVETTRGTIETPYV